MAFQPADKLANRTFIGLVVAQFLAAFNDQAIHASAMFFAINQQTLSEATAISLMPILFYAPWAIFCTVAGYFSDRYSKRQSLVVWKFAEVGITLIALAGFWLGTHGHWSGSWIVLSTVFLMGTHSAFFVPAKYGVMPEILQPHLLSKANGVLESLSFLAVILGTVTGGILSFLFLGREYVIGIILVALAVIGALSSLLIKRMPAADPNRKFPPNIYQPLIKSLQTLWRSRPLRVAVLGIAFFTFIVAFMRSTVYMHGESRIPRWTEFRTSIVVGMSALGIGLGSPLAGYLSGGKVELGLVPLGAVGMIIAAIIAAIYLNSLPALIVCIILIGFFTGFYIVPLFTQLQHRAPKTSKGDAVATSNFINVTGAILASLLFFGLDSAAHWTGLAPEVVQQDRWAEGKLKRVDYDKDGRPVYFVVDAPGPRIKISKRAGKPISPTQDVDIESPIEEPPIDPSTPVIRMGRGLEPATAVRPKGPPIASDKPSQVIVSTYTIHGVVHYQLRDVEKPLATVHNDEGLPRYLFLGTALMTMLTLVLLRWQLPDLILRSILFLRTHGRHPLKVVGIQNLPTGGPVILATNCDRFDQSLQVISATDRHTRFVLLESPDDTGARQAWLRYLVRRVGMIVLRRGKSDGVARQHAVTIANRTLASGGVLAMTLETENGTAEADELFEGLTQRSGAVILPVYCSNASRDTNHKNRVIIGHAMNPIATADEIRQNIRLIEGRVDAADKIGTPLSSVTFPEVDGRSRENRPT